MPSSSEPARRRVLLFDVDGTLVHAGGAGRRSLERVLLREVGPLDHSLARLRLDGMTDRLIVREVLAALGRDFDDALCDRVLEGYVEALREEIEGPGFQVLPGVTELLGTLSRAGTALGLCTGNVAEGALLKLRRGGLDVFFEWGPEAVSGFAADGEARERIVEAALRRAARRLGPGFRPTDALVIGDTPRDVSAARAMGVPVLAVATGRFGPAELLQSGADLVLPSLVESAEMLLAWASGATPLPGA
jgi:phosphoglycolate phosphatase-like HAD superfamily hydrolase